MALRYGLVIPFYNFGLGLQKTLAALELWHQERGHDFSVCFVDDGSQDGGAQIVRNFLQKNSSWASLVELGQNQGKGKAIRAGFNSLRERSEIIFFTDCDLHYGLDVITQVLIDELKENDVVILDRSWAHGSRGSPFLRTVASAIFNRLVAVLTGVAFRDTQAGLKGFKVSSCAPVFERLTLNGFAFDVEVLSIALFYRLRISLIPIRFSPDHEVPVGSTIQLGWSSLSMLVALFKINWNWKRNLYTHPDLEKRIESRVFTIY